MKTRELPLLPVGLLDEEGCLTQHAEKRLSERGIPRKAVIAVLFFGRTIHVRGADIYVIGRNEVSRSRQEGLDLSDYEGIHVICSGEGCVLTVYRNHELRGLRPRRRQRHSQRARIASPGLRGMASWPLGEQPEDSPSYADGSQMRP